MRARRLLAAGLVALAVAPAATAEARTRLRAFASCGQLVSYARAHAAAAPGLMPVAVPPRETGAPGTTATPTAASPAPASAPAEPDYSGTNVQEAGIDEPDVVKTDGRTIYAVSAGGIQALDARAAEPKLVGTLTVPGAYSAQLLLHGDRLLVVAAQYAQPIALRAAIAPIYAGSPVTTITEVDVHDPAAMRIVRTTTADGAFVDARQTGATARLVLSSPPEPLQPGEPIARTGVATWMPSRRTVSGNGVVGKVRKLLGCRAVRRPAAFSGLGLLTVLTIDMDKGLPAVDADAIMTSAETVYGSADSLYVATERYFDPSTPAGVLNGERATTIHRFDASQPGQTTYRASGVLTGFLLNQFSMSEDGGVLRVATTETPSWFSATTAPAELSQSYVTVLREHDGQLEQIGRVGGIGAGERIYAVRFLGSTGYVVTFRQVDPLYTLDLSDPQHPRVAGQLELLGYSAYLHPLGDNLLLGVGREASQSGRTAGVQLSVFDVSDPANPKRVGHTVLDGYSSTEAEWDHHAFLYWPRTRLVVLPVDSYGPDSFFGAIGFRVPPDGSVSEVGRVSADAPSSSVRRSVVVGDRLFTLTGDGVVVSRLDTLDRLGWVAFPGQPQPEPGVKQG